MGERERFKLVHSVYEDDIERPESALAEIDFAASGQEGDIEMSIYYKPVDVGGWDRRVALYLSARQARSIAYSLLWYANDLEEPTGR